MIGLSLGEVETLAAKAARGAGFAWGLADDVGRAARVLAREGQDWSAALLALIDEPPEASVCPVRLAAAINDAPPPFEGALALGRVARPLWLDALLAGPGLFRVEGDLAAPFAEVALRRGRASACAPARRAAIAPERLAALNGYAARLYVPESESSRRRGAGGGRVDDE